MTSANRTWRQTRKRAFAGEVEGSLRRAKAKAEWHCPRWSSRSRKRRCRSHRKSGSCRNHRTFTRRDTLASRANRTACGPAAGLRRRGRPWRCRHRVSAGRRSCLRAEKRREAPPFWISRRSLSHGSFRRSDSSSPARRRGNSHARSPRQSRHIPQKQKQPGRRGRGFGFFVAEAPGCSSAPSSRRRSPFSYRQLRLAEAADVFVSSLWRFVGSLRCDVKAVLRSVQLAPRQLRRGQATVTFTPLPRLKPRKSASQLRSRAR